MKDVYHGVGIMGWYFICWMQMFNYTGKSSFQEYWFFVGLSLVLLSFCSLPLVQFDWSPVYLYVLGAINAVPYMAVLVRRIRDAGYSPWNVCWRFLPIVGQAFLLYITTRSTCNDEGGRCFFHRKPEVSVFRSAAFND